MKKSVLFGTAILTAALCATALTGCNSSNIKVEDYATALEDSAYVASAKRYTTATLLEGRVETTSLTNGLVRVLKSDGKYGVYDLEKKEFLRNGATFDRAVFTHYPFILLTNNTTGESGAQSLYSVMTPNGDLVSFNDTTEFAEMPTFDQGSYLVKSVQKTIYTVTVGGYRRYYVFSDTRGSDYGKNFQEIAENDIYGLLSVNTTFSNISHYAVYEKETSYDGYTYSKTFVSTGSASGSLGIQLGTTAYTFFKDGEEIGDCTFSNGNSFFLGNCLYYYEMTSVDSDATKGYNLVLSSTVNYKFNVTYYRYDFTKNKTKKISTDYIFLDFQALYNQNDKNFDCAVALGYKKENGVAVVGAATGISTVLVGNKLKVKGDYTGQEFLPWKATKIADNRYLVRGESDAGYYLFDGDLKTLAVYAQQPTVYADAKIITSTSASQYYATDTNGKILMRNLYGAYVFYGNTALLTIDGVKTFVNLDGTTETFDARFSGGIEQGGLVRVLSGGECRVYNYEGGTTIASIPTSTTPQQAACGKYQCMPFTANDGKTQTYLFE